MATHQDAKEPLEELFENRPTGVEVEGEDEIPSESDVSQPYSRH